MKILYLGNFGDRTYEGMKAISTKLMKHFAKGNEVFLNDLSYVDDCIVNAHSSGFFEAIRYRHIPMIYSLHSNIVPLYFENVRDYLNGFSLYYSRKLEFFSKAQFLREILFKTLSHFTPLFVKRMVLKRMKLVILPNRWLSRKLRLPNSIVINHGIDTKRFKPKKVKRNKLVVSFFGHPAPGKGFFEVVKAFTALDPKKYSKNMYFTLKSDDIIRYIRKKDKNISVHGLVDDIVAEYNKADIVVLPFRHSSAAIATPLVMVEAMGCGKAVITTDLPHIREIGGKSCLYVRPYSIKGVIKAIKHLANRPEKIKQLGKLARKRIVDHYNQELMFKRYEAVYEQEKHQ